MAVLTLQELESKRWECADILGPGFEAFGKETINKHLSLGMFSI